MMRPLLGIVFSPSDKIELTGPLQHTIVTNSLVTERRPDWDPNMQCRVSCPDEEQVRCQKQEITQIHVFCCPHSKLPLTHLQSCTAVSSSSKQSHQRSPFHSPDSPRPRTFSCLAFVHFFFTDHQLNCFCLLDNFIHFYFYFASSIYSSVM